MTVILTADDAAIARAAQILVEGGVVAFPTDTVYGLGCDLFSPEAVGRIYAIKGRPTYLPLIAMFAETAQWSQVASVLPEYARTYMQHWWPGPLTVIVPARADVPSLVLGEGTTIGMRIPAEPVALALLRRVGRPLATTSANRSGQPAAATAQEVEAQLGSAVDLILDVGRLLPGTASTVVDCAIDPPKVLREGPITAAMLGLA